MGDDLTSRVKAKAKLPCNKVCAEVSYFTFIVLIKFNMILSIQNGSEWTEGIDMK